MENSSKYKNDFTPFLRTAKSKFKNGSTLQIRSFLYLKYSSSQNYYFTRDVNSLIGGAQTVFTIQYQDEVFLMTKEESLRRTYKDTEYQSKIKYLTEYYKFHDDVPRFFQVSFAQIVYNFYDKKRRIKYIVITRLLNGNMGGEKINIHDSEAMTISQADVSCNSSLMNLIPKDLKDSLYRKQEKVARENRRKKDKPNGINKSVTINDLCDVLGEIFRPKKTGYSLYNDESITISIKNEREPIMSSLTKNENIFKKTQLIMTNNGQSQTKAKAPSSDKNKIAVGKLNFKNIMAKKFDNEEFLKILARKMATKDQSKHRDSIIPNFVTQDVCKNIISANLQNESQKNSQPMKINNLNININFTSLSKKDIKNTKIDPIGKDIGRIESKNNQILITLKNSHDEPTVTNEKWKEKNELGKIDSPTYSLLHKFKQEKPNLIENDEPRKESKKKSSKNSPSKSKKRQILENLGKIKFLKKKSTEKFEQQNDDHKIQNSISRTTNQYISDKKGLETKKSSNSKKIQTIRSPNIKNIIKGQDNPLIPNYEALVKNSFQKAAKNTYNFDLKCSKNANIMYSKNSQKSSPMVFSKISSKKRIFMSHDGIQNKPNLFQEKKKSQCLKSSSRKNCNMQLLSNPALKASRTFEKNDLGYFCKLLDINSNKLHEKPAMLAYGNKGTFHLDHEQTFDMRWKGALKLADFKKETLNLKNLKASGETLLRS